MAGELRRFWAVRRHARAGDGNRPGAPGRARHSRRARRPAALLRGTDGPRLAGADRGPAQPGRCPVSRLSVAVVITRLQAGAGGVALRGAQALDPERYEVTIIAGDCGGGADSDGSGDSMLARAAAAGLNVGSVPELVSPISPGNDRRALRRLTELPGAGRLRRGAHPQREGRRARPAGRGTRRDAPGGAHVPRLPVPRVPVPGPARGLRRHRALPGRRTDVFLAVGGAVAAEAVRRGIAVPERVRVINPAIELARRPGQRGGPGRRTAAARGASRLQDRRDRGPGRLPEGPRDPSSMPSPGWTGRTCTRSGSGTARCAGEMEAARRPPGAAGPLPVRRAPRRRAASCCPGSTSSPWPAGTKACPARSPRPWPPACRWWPPR